MGLVAVLFLAADSTPRSVSSRVVVSTGVSKIVADGLPLSGLRMTVQGANSLIITVFGEEEQSGDGCEHTLELADRAAVAAAFPAEHPPCLHLCHGVLDGGADLAEDRVEFT